MASKHLLTATLLTASLTVQAQNNWTRNGNSIATGDFIGSTNSNPLVFKINTNTQVASMSANLFTVSKPMTVNGAIINTSTYNGTGILTNTANIIGNSDLLIAGNTTTNNLNLSKYNGGAALRLLQIDNSGAVSPFALGTNSNQYLSGLGVWTNLPTPPTQYFTATNATDIATTYNLRAGNTLSVGAVLDPLATIKANASATQQGAVLLDIKNANTTNTYGIKTLTKDNQYVITNTANYLDDNGNPIVAQNFSVNSRGVVDATNYTQGGVPLGAWKRLTNSNSVVETYLSYNASPISIGTTTSPAQSLRSFVTKNACAAPSVQATSYYNAQLLNMEGNDPTLIFKDNVVTAGSPNTSDLLIGAANGTARFVTNDGFAFFMNADNQTTPTGFNGFKILKESPFFGCNEKEVLLLQPDGEFTIRGNTQFTPTDNRLLQLSNTGKLFTREVDASQYLLNGQPLGVWSVIQPASQLPYTTIGYSVALGSPTVSPAEALRLFVNKNTSHALAVGHYNSYTLSSLEGYGPTMIYKDNAPNGADLAIASAGGYGRIATNNGLSIFINTDNKTPVAGSAASNFKIIANDSYLSGSQKERLDFSPLGVLTLNADASVTTQADKSVFAINTGATRQFEVRANGYVYAREVNVVATGSSFPDYVFEKNYNLKTLSEVEAYINLNKHLPNIPSAKEIDEKGTVSLADMNLKLLEKVEELTLYAIEQNKRIENLEKKLLQSTVPAKQ